MKIQILSHLSSKNYEFTFIKFDLLLLKSFSTIPRLHPNSPRFLSFDFIEFSMIKLFNKYKQYETTRVHPYLTHGGFPMVPRV
jgi:hypothetical protein